MQKLSALARHPQYNRVIAVYTQEFVASGGRLNEKKFYEAHVAPLVPGFKLRSWYQLIEKFRKKAGLGASQAVAAAQAAPVATEEKKLEMALMTNDQATQLGIGAALTIGARALEELLKDPEKLAAMTTKERTELLFKAMKSQDSRIHAIGKLKSDNREEAKFNKTFGNAAM